MAIVGRHCSRDVRARLQLLRHGIIDCFFAHNVHRSKPFAILVVRKDDSLKVILAGNQASYSIVMRMVDHTKRGLG